MNKNESKYFKSAEKMHTALMTLLDSKDFEYISVKELCETAGVNRSTFYLHYDNVNDLLQETVEAVYKDFFGRFGAEGSGEINIDDKNEDELFLITPRYLVPYLDFVEENRKLFYLMYEKNEMMGADKTYETWFKTIFAPILTRFGVPQSEQHFIMVFYLKGIIGVITEWVRGGCIESKDEIISVIQRCVIKP
ncbi:MAG: TetR/AcrR family transcriptional regulator [Lachnospiraceae bacterium]|uniref:TetR/AcrR family transcriptional regulator n=1 Tax=Pseudobutyrivibrio sp. TaxID=2014367 RepID=UPI0025F0F448|nr:TetR/AcrR family transcriptional regulator [Pseudobutyrivibrio sp.]MBQ8488283.1 TetR/AcrR family transcriptional regulator [Pseudobutyrivibrio sp.]MBQ8913876.1 TetR/AcrR family transcriptional regulator [Lachnospiraceae bacterium]